MYLHENTALVIGERRGKVVKNSINRKSIVAHRYLHFRVDIEVENPLPIGFFLERSKGKNPWIQFKIERLGDFCYSCRRLTHVTRKCFLASPATISSGDGSWAWLYGLWLRSKTMGGTPFDISSVDVKDQCQLSNTVELGKSRGGKVPNIFWLKDNRNHKCSEIMEIGQTNSSLSQNSQMEENDNVKALCPELKALSLSLRNLDLDGENELQEAVL